MQSPPIPSDTIIETDTLAPGTVYPKLPVPIDNGGEVYFDKSSYMVAMREGTLYDSVLKLRPAEGKSAANICGYEMLATGTPFVVDAHGKMAILVYVTSCLVLIKKRYIRGPYGGFNMDPLFMLWNQRPIYGQAHLKGMQGYCYSRNGQLWLMMGTRKFYFA